MVRRGGYRTAPQRDRQNRRRGGGKTRTERLRENLDRKRRQLRENEQKEPTFHTKPISKYVDGRQQSRDDFAVYGIYNDGSEWVLTGLSASDTYETTRGTGRSQRSRIKVRGRYIAHSNGTIQPRAGVEIARFDTKKAAMRKINADGSEMLEAGRYLVRPKHDPRSFHIERVDHDEWQSFIDSRKTVKVRE
jgi:hypothetical protein